MQLNVNTDMIKKKCVTCEIKCEHCECYLEYTNVKNDLIVYKCLSYNRNYQKRMIKTLKKRFANTHKISSHDINKFILLLRKCWENFTKHRYMKKKNLTIN